MCLFKFFKPKAKKEAAPKKEKAKLILGGEGAGKARRADGKPFVEAPDEEFQLPPLKIGNFAMTEELRRRQQNEQLMAKYGIHLEKEGRYI